MDEMLTFNMRKPPQRWEDLENVMRRANYYAENFDRGYPYTASFSRSPMRQVGYGILRKAYQIARRFAGLVASDAPFRLSSADLIAGLSLDREAASVRLADLDVPGIHEEVYRLQELSGEEFDAQLPVAWYYLRAAASMPAGALQISD